jgi:glycosyltransferase involved in cell wall biosynthesis
LTRALLDLAGGPEIVALGGNPASIPSGMSHTREPAHPPTNLGWTLVGLPRAAARAHVDVLHAPAYTAPFWSPAPVVLTIHDVSYARHPEWYPYRSDRARQAFYRYSAKRADAILTDSEFSAEEIEKAYGIPKRRIAVVPLGVDEAFRLMAEATEASWLPPSAGSGAEASWLPPSGGSCALPAGITTPFVLHVGDLHERRNLPVVVDAVLEARRRFGPAAGVSLVLAGVDRGVGTGLCAMARAAGMPDAVVLLGRVEEALLHTLYRCAAALVYPSMYEGFGLPVLEAMACGTPVIASHAASIPEVAGDAGVLLDPREPGAWVEAVVRVVNDHRWRDELAQKGLARAAGFTWERTARETLDVYRRAAHLHRASGGQVRA